MTESKSHYEPFHAPPTEQEDSDAWGIWAVAFLDRFNQMWTAWQQSWTRREVPQYQEGNPDAFFVLERRTRYIGKSIELTTGSLPSKLITASHMLEVCSGAVLRFSDQSAWRFMSPEQASEVAEELLKIGQIIQAGRYQHVSMESLEKIYRWVKMAIMRPASFSVSKQHSHETTQLPHHTPKAKPSGGRPPLSANEQDKRKQLVESWIESKDANVCKAKYCSDNKVTTDELDKYINWYQTKRRRSNQL